ncbi:fatty acid oxygenase [Fusarium mundagurra]|uniref:Fatty acid oxygenase n=1 Tax=Fusarium mundagurra TaxID=1567541 RepID=A0A8H5XZK5_9HYPO|nr:fatty acid oxygenase [Fusarium mundagurra]
MATEKPQWPNNNTGTLTTVNSEGNIRLPDMKFDIVEDIPAELEDFIFFSRLGIFEEAHGLFEQNLRPYLESFPVLAEYADMLLEEGLYADLSQLLTSLDWTRYSEGERNLLDLIKALSEAYIGQRPREAGKRRVIAGPRLDAALDQAKNWHDKLQNGSHSFSGLKAHTLELYLSIIVLADINSYDLDRKYHQPPWFPTDSTNRWEGFIKWFELLIQQERFWEAQKIFTILVPVLPPETVSKMFRECCDSSRNCPRTDASAVAELAATNTYFSWVSQQNDQWNRQGTSSQVSDEAMASVLNAEILFQYLFRGHAALRGRLFCEWHDNLQRLRKQVRPENVIPRFPASDGATEAALAGGIVDDRKYLVENIMQLAASLPNGSRARDDLNAAFIKRLWDNLRHRPLSYLGDEFRYRAADGSNNNILYPHLGAAGSHYARSVVPKHKRTSILPDPSLIFDSLLARNGSAKENPSKVSSCLFYLATVLIHGMQKYAILVGYMNKLRNSSYLDLSPLYGKNMEEQAKVRTFKDGRLKNDVFSEDRLLTQPPGVCALMIAFNRFHNYVVGELATINEDRRFSLAEGVTHGHPDYDKAQLKRDNDLFQTGRLVTCGLYVNIIVSDYLRTILNLNRNPIASDWKLDPRDDFSEVFDSQGTPRGIGNQGSANGAGVCREKWTCGGFTRLEDGRFPDAELVRLLQVGTENVAGKYSCNGLGWCRVVKLTSISSLGAFGARNIPRVFKALEVYGIQQGRQWGLATLNEFRQFFKLKPYTTFADINSDPSVAEALEAMYGHPDNVELYLGLLAEETKKPLEPGSGLCPGFTTSFAIMSDAVALVRGDRFYTVDYSPSNLTSFGYTEISSDFDVAGGGMMYKLLMRAFPGWYRANSVYALYPFTTPEANFEAFMKLGTSQDFDFNKPSFIGPPTPITSWQGVVDVLNDQEHFHVPWGNHTFQLTHHDYMLSGGTPANTEQRGFVKQCLYSPESGLEEVRHFYESITAELSRQHSRKVGESYQVDIVRDIGNLAHAHFTSQFFGIPLQEYGAGSDSYTARALSDVLANLFGYVFLDLDTAASYKNRVVAAAETKSLGEKMQTMIAEIKAQPFPSLRHMLRIASSDGVLRSYGVELIDRLLESGKGVDDAVWTIIPTAAAACATQAQGWAQMIDMYLSDKYYSHWPAIQKLAMSDEPEAFEKLKKYALEGFRLSTPAFGLLRTVVADKADLRDGPRVVSVKKGDTIFTDFVTAGLDATKFPDPYEIKLDRPDDLYIHHGWGPHACLGRPIVTVAGASMLRVCARLGNLRRAPGQAGEMKSKTVNDAFKVYLAENGSKWGPFPVSKKVVFDKTNEIMPYLVSVKCAGVKHSLEIDVFIIQRREAKRAVEREEEHTNE